ncbi:unnamed protein product [Effrenium voratum]|nr:unnamed protein product [Effrenium voratum]
MPAPYAVSDAGDYSQARIGKASPKSRGGEKAELASASGLGFDVQETAQGKVEQSTSREYQIVGAETEAEGLNTGPFSAEAQGAGACLQGFCGEAPFAHRLRAESAEARGEPGEPGAGAVVLGGGAAGLLAAMTAGRRGRKVTLLEKNPELGKKIRISGGGRCNFTNISDTLDVAYHSSRSSSNEAAFFEKAFARYPPEKFIGLVESHGEGQKLR